MIKTNFEPNPYIMKEFNSIINKLNMGHDFADFYGNVNSEYLEAKDIKTLYLYQNQNKILKQLRKDKINKIITKIK
jgi:hypothetical protein